MTEGKRYFNRRDAAAYLGVSVRKLDEWLAARRIRIIRAGSRVILDRSDLDRFYGTLKTTTKT